MLSIQLTVLDVMKHSSTPSQPKVILFLCTGNSCRSQMAEGFARIMAPAATQIYSAGVSPVGVNPFAVKVMEEIGVDIQSQTSKGISAVPVDKINTIITLCGHAARYCPSFPKSVESHHWPIDDPVRARGTDEEVLRAFRTARDEIQNRIKTFFERLGSD
jgi:arsenate reductase (thioredoxin)